MSRRRNRPDRLSEAERASLVAAAEGLHRACVAPRLATGGPDHRVLVDLNMAIVRALEALTGEPAPWARLAVAGSRTTPRAPAPDGGTDPA